MVIIKDVEKGSAADKKKLLPGDILISIDGHEINDVLDYRFYLSEKKITLKIHRGAELFDVTIKKEEYDDIGLEFETFLMDKKRSCKNKCIFCFIDQNPCGMRETIYFKDDDSRLSFLQGNYVTMTNMTDADLDRIIEMHMSPVNVSVHTTESDLRVFMMKNPRAALIMEQLDKLCSAGIKVNAQIVLCKGVNDGEHLMRTMRDLESLYPNVGSVSIVPAGLTCHREGLFPLSTFSREESAEVIDTVGAFGDECKKKYGERIFYCADELFIEAGRELPDEDYYDGYPQIENGVGLMRGMESELCEALEDLSDSDCANREVSVATGAAAYLYIRKLCRKIEARFKNLKINVYKIENDFFGRSVTVAGLVCGGDLISQLRGKALGEKLVIPDVMLRSGEEIFLDGVTVADVERELNIKVEANRTDGYDFLGKIIG